MKLINCELTTLNAILALMGISCREDEIMTSDRLVGFRINCREIEIPAGRTTIGALLNLYLDHVRAQ